MLSFALIVFREVIEISLIVSILMLAMRGVSNRARWVLLGLTSGFIGSLCVAYFTEQISLLAEGMGQELFNASVLLACAVLMGFTVLWMTHHGKSMSNDLRKLGGEVQSGTKPLSMVAVVVGLSMLREGSEVALLTHGVIVSGGSSFSLLFGGALGLIGGVLFGIALYAGLLGAATRRVFQIANGLLIFVAAGMVSQALGLLTAADILSFSSKPLWNSSWFIEEHSLLGQMLHTLIGYTARPSFLQIVAYLSTACGLFFLHRIVGSINRRSGQVVSAVALLLTLTWSTPAWAIDKIYSPNLEEGEIEIEKRGRYSNDHRDAKADEFKGVFGVGYTPLPWYAIEMYGIVENSADEPAELEGVELENRFQVFEPGEGFVDLGFYAAVEYEHEPNNFELEGKVLLQKDIERFSQVMNLSIAVADIADEQEVEPELSLRSNYRMLPELQPGIEWHSSFNEVDRMGSFSDQTHVAGPSLYGKLFGRIRYEVAYLLGVSSEAPDRTARWTLEYEFRI